MQAARLKRREFLVAGAAGLAGLALGPARVRPLRAGTGAMPMRALGRTGESVSLLGLGGWHVGVTSLSDQQAVALMRTAIDGGVTFFDNAREYNDGRSEERMGLALAGGYRDRVFLMTKNCAHTRTGEESMRNLEASLRALRTDRIDLWLFHEVVYDNDPDWIFERGALAAAIEARRQGKVRFLGFSGHKHPDIHLDMLARDFRWDAVMMPLNVLDAHFRSFEREVLPVLNDRGIGSIAMKSLTGFLSSMLALTGIPARDCLRYVMSLPISTMVSGMEHIEILEENLRIARSFTPMADAERAALLARSRPFARDGRFERYKTTLEFEAPPGQAAHGFR